MSRVVIKGKEFAMAFGVDRSPSIGAFVQVWNHTIGDGGPCFNPEDEGYFNGVVRHDCSTAEGRNLTEEFVIELARKHSIPVDPREVYEIFD
jgi:hypothetical protein